jgi:hypothetical protein
MLSWNSGVAGLTLRQDGTAGVDAAPSSRSSAKQRKGTRRSGVSFQTTCLRAVLESGAAPGRPARADAVLA